MIKNKYIILLLMWISLIVASALVPVSSVADGVWHFSLATLKGVLIIFSWGIFYYVIKISFFNNYALVYGKDIPHIFITTVRLVILTCMLFSIMVFVLGKSAWGAIALGSTIAVAAGWALKDLIHDAFAGIILELEGNFEKNDWIKIHGGEEGRVVRTTWRNVILQTHEEYLVVIPNREVEHGFINHSKPSPMYWDAVEICLAHEVPVERAARILRAGAMKAPSVHQEQCSVTAKETSIHGITYEVRYLLPEHEYFREVRHDVIAHVTNHLHEYKLRISEGIGEYAVIEGGHPYKEVPPLEVENLIQKVDFFKSLPSSIISKLATNATKQFYAEGDVIVSEGEEGQSMFLIGEGMVKISIAYKMDTGEERQKTLFQLGFPDSFGEMALLLNDKRSATVTAVMDTIVYEVSQDLLKKSLKGNHEIFDKMKQQAVDKKEKNKLTKSQMEKLKEQQAIQAKGVLSNLKKFFT